MTAICVFRDVDIDVVRDDTELELRTIIRWFVSALKRCWVRVSVILIIEVLRWLTVALARMCPLICSVSRVSLRRS